MYSTLYCYECLHQAQNVNLFTTGLSVLVRHSPTDWEIVGTTLAIALVKALFFNPKVLIFFLFLHKNICCTD